MKTRKPPTLNAAEINWMPIEMSKEEKEHLDRCSYETLTREYLRRLTRLEKKSGLNTAP